MQKIFPQKLIKKKSLIQFLLPYNFFSVNKTLFSISRISKYLKDLKILKLGIRKTKQHFNGRGVVQQKLFKSGPITKFRSLVKIMNTDGLCLARSIATSLARIEYGPKDNKFRKMMKNTFDCQTRAAIRLLQLANLPANLEAYNLRHANSIQRFLDRADPSRYRIVIFDGQNNYKVIYKGATPAKHNLTILLSNGHFQPIGRPKELFRVK